MIYRLSILYGVEKKQDSLSRNFDKYLDYPLEKDDPRIVMTIITIYRQQVASGGICNNGRYNGTVINEKRQDITIEKKHQIC